MKNKGFGLIQLLISIVVLITAGMFAYKRYFSAGEKTLKEVPAVYTENMPQDSSRQSVTPAKTESVHARKAKELEGRTFISSVITAERAYEAVNGRFFYTGWVSESKDLGINTRGNQYFKDFLVEKKDGGGFVVKVRGSGELEGVILTSE